jgi:hypothetical protein
MARRPQPQSLSADALANAIAVAQEAASDLAAAYEHWELPWRLARRFKSVPGLADADPRLLRRAVIAFCEHPDVADALANTEYGDGPWEFFEAFQVDWYGIQYAEGQGPLELAAQRADVRRVRLPDAASPRYVKLVGIARELQVIAGDVPIFLPIPRLACLLDTARGHVSKLIARAIDDEYLLPIDLTYEPGKRARTFRFNPNAQLASPVDAKR